MKLKSLGHVSTRLVPLALFAPSIAFAQSLPPVYVTAPTPWQKSLETPVSTTLITQEEIAASPYTSLAKILRVMGGITVRPALDGSRNGTIDIRGFGEVAQNNVVVVVDGIRLNENEQATPRFSNIPLSSIQSIEIIRGGSSVEYGNGATGGVIRITTKKGAEGDKPQFDVTTSYGSYNTQELDLAFRKQLGEFALGLTGSKASTNGYRHNSEANYDQAGFTLDFAHADYKAGVSASFEGQNNRFPGSLTPAQAAQNPQSTTKPNDYGVFNRNMYTAYAAKRIDGNEYGLNLSRREQLSMGVFSGFNSTRELYQDQISPYIELNFTAAGQHKLRLGYDQQNWNITRSTLDTLPATQKSQAIYALDDWKLDSQWRLSLGSRIARAEQVRNANQNSYSLLANEVGATFAWKPKTVFSVKLARSYRLPNIDDNGFATSTFLVPQISNEIDLGVRHSYAHSVVTARVFVMNLDHEILYDPTVGGGKNTNLDKTRRRGTELSWKGSIGHSTLASVSYQYLDSEFRIGARAGGRLPLVPKQKLTANVDYSFNSRWTAGTTWRVQSNQRPGGDIKQKYSNTAIPGFGTLDFNIGYKVNNLAWSFQILNALDRSYYEYAFGNTGVYPQPGRTFQLTLKTSF